MKTLNQAIKEANFTSTCCPGEKFHVEETTDCWEIYSSVFGDDEPATTYRKCDYSLQEVIEDYKENGIY